MGMKVGLATYDWVQVISDGVGRPALQGPGWIRLGQYAQNSSLETQLGTPVWDEGAGCYGIRQGEETDLDCPLIVAQRLMGKEDPEQVARAVANGQTVVIDIDDWYWGVTSSSDAYQKIHPSQNSEYNTDFFRQVISNASAVIVSTPFLLDAIDWIPNSRKHLLENHLNFAEFNKRVHTDSPKPRVGWTGLAPLHARDLRVLYPVFSRVVKEFSFHHTGFVNMKPYFHTLVGLQANQVYSFREMPTSAYQKEGFPFDIGVVPLVSSPFNDAKSWLKGLEYAAAGIPFVASPTQEYKRLLGRFGVGRLASNSKDWLFNLRSLKQGYARKVEADENLEKLKPLDLSAGVVKWDSLIESLV